MQVLQSAGLLITLGANGVLLVCKLPWPEVPGTGPEWPGCSLVVDSHIQVTHSSVAQAASAGGGTASPVQLCILGLPSISIM